MYREDNIDLGLGGGLKPILYLILNILFCRLGGETDQRDPACVKSSS